MYKYLKYILIYSPILTYSCTDKVHAEKGLASTTNAQQTYETKNFNTIIHGFKKYIEISRKKNIEDEKKNIEDEKRNIEDEKKNIEDEKKNIEDEKRNIEDKKYNIEYKKRIIEDEKRIIKYEKQNIEDEKKNIEDKKKIIINYDQFISWIEKNPDKKKELDEAWTEAYNLLEQRRAENAPEKTLKEYISDAIDCALNPTCQDTKKYGTQYNQIFDFFEQISRNTSLNRSDPKEIFIKFKTLNISPLKDNF
ncbi:Mlp lipoprotein family protein (plasmid) [Borrelia crocidurae DOU]|uniref:Mlp lipoprotein family protein n=1 Tax=Borrelia crocidurae DOU TaxID=1293575 RepID=W5SK69_9SPIR|nr:hypothetical protein [Borrelia crocidurae]AHH07048.1 Mlp lipoprotein family protein [Borrelia crocidurae DOU]